MAVWRDPLLIGRATAVVAQARVALVPQAAVPKPLPPRIVPVTAVEARQGDMDLNLNGLGTVVASNTVIIRSRVDGELIEVAFAEGQPVEAGDLLAVVDPRPYEVQLRRAEAELARDEAAVQAAKRDLERYESLAELRQATQQQIETQQTLVRQAEAVAKIDRSLIDTAKLQLDYCRIEAPISGRIGLRLVDAGNIVRAGDAAGLAVVRARAPTSMPGSATLTLVAAAAACAVLVLRWTPSISVATATFPILSAYPSQTRSSIASTPSSAMRPLPVARSTRPVMLALP